MCNNPNTYNVLKCSAKILLFSKQVLTLFEIVLEYLTLSFEKHIFLRKAFKNPIIFNLSL